MEKEKTSVFIDGFYGYKNLGDDYILNSILDILSSQNFEAYILSKYDDIPAMIIGSFPS